MLLSRLLGLYYRSDETDNFVTSPKLHQNVMTQIWSRVSPATHVADAL